MKVIDEMDEILLGINEQNITGYYVLHDLKLGLKKINIVIIQLKQITVKFVEFNGF